jgi:histidinol dehydrogenase
MYVSKEGFEKVAEYAQDIAKAEGLIAHYGAVEVRRKQ